MWMKRCMFCRQLRCGAKDCEVPKCRATCLPMATDKNCDWFYVCAACYQRAMGKFEGQFHRNRIASISDVAQFMSDDDMA